MSDSDSHSPISCGGSDIDSESGCDSHIAISSGGGNDIDSDSGSDSHTAISGGGGNDNNQRATAF